MTFYMSKPFVGQFDSFSVCSLLSKSFTPSRLSRLFSDVCFKTFDFPINDSCSLNFSLLSNSSLELGSLTSPYSERYLTFAERLGCDLSEVSDDCDTDSLVSFDSLVCVDHNFSYGTFSLLHFYEGSNATANETFFLNRIKKSHVVVFFEDISCTSSLFNSSSQKLIQVRSSDSDARLPLLFAFFFFLPLLLARMFQLN